MRAASCGVAAASATSSRLACRPSAQRDSKWARFACCSRCVGSACGQARLPGRSISATSAGRPACAVCGRTVVTSAVSGQIAQRDLPFTAVFGHHDDRRVFRCGARGQQRQGAVRSMNLSAAAEGMQRVCQLAIMRRQRCFLSPQRRKQARAIVDAQLRRQRHGLRPEMPVQRLLPLVAVAALAIPQHQHIAVAEAVEGDGLAVARQRLQMAGDRAGVPVQPEAAHRGGIERDGQPLRFIEQREGERILGARRRRDGAVTHRQRGVCVQPFCAGASAASRWALAAVLWPYRPIATCSGCAFANCSARLWQRRRRSVRRSASCSKRVDCRRAASTQRSPAECRC